MINHTISFETPLGVFTFCLLKCSKVD